MEFVCRSTGYRQLKIEITVIVVDESQLELQGMGEKADISKQQKTL